jgi:hypothetical protein
MIEVEVLPPLNAMEVVGRLTASIRGYTLPSFVRDDYLASYAGVEARHCVWEERAPAFESIVAQWVSGGFRQ